MPFNLQAALARGRPRSGSQYQMGSLLTVRAAANSAMRKTINPIPFPTPLTRGVAAVLVSSGSASFVPAVNRLSDVDLLRDLDRIVDLDAKVAHGAQTIALPLLMDGTEASGVVVADVGDRVLDTGRCDARSRAIGAFPRHPARGAGPAELALPQARAKRDAHRCGRRSWL